MKNPAFAYRQFSVQGASPLGLVVMLYDGALAAMRRAVTAIEAKDTSEKCASLKRALAIIAQLEGTLDFAQGGEVARTLKALYIHARAQMLKASIENSAEVLNALIKNFGGVREAWHQADLRTSAGGAAARRENASPSAAAPVEAGSLRIDA